MIKPLQKQGSVQSNPEQPSHLLDRHAGTPETSNSMYLIPKLVDLSQAVTAELSLPEHLQSMLPYVLEGDPVALSVFLAEGLKDKNTGKGTSAIEMSSTGVWGTRNPTESTSERGRRNTQSFVDASVTFIERWNVLRPVGTSQ